MLCGIIRFKFIEPSTINYYGGSDDDRYYYEHYEGKDYYEEVGHGWPRLSFDVVIFVIFAIFLLILEFMD